VWERALCPVQAAQPYRDAANVASREEASPEGVRERTTG
jgi:hypothetical protein